MWVVLHAPVGPPISAVISGGRCITFDESCCLVWR
jgi:hypothetical protein